MSAELVAYAKKCESSAGDYRAAVVDYPKQITAKMNEATTYKTVVDMRSRPAAPESVIPYADETSSDAVTVRCRLAARLTAVTEDIGVQPGASDLETGWRYQSWSPSGVLEWSWTIKPTSPHEQKLRLEITPAVTGGPENFDDLNRVSYETLVPVHATRLQSTWFFFMHDWNMVSAIAKVLGAAIVGVLGWIALYRRRKAEALRPQADSGHGPSSGAVTPTNGSSST